jgi:hypothetical protein
MNQLRNEPSFSCHPLKKGTIILSLTNDLFPYHICTLVLYCYLLFYNVVLISCKALYWVHHSVTVGYCGLEI